jgi:hypothetical protein
MQEKITLQLLIEPARQGTYFTLPFTMPAGIESLSLVYHYERYRESEIYQERGSFSARQEINIIDLGLISPDGAQVGASGADKTEIFLTETRATPGYHPHSLDPGEWQILVGAYKVQPEGLTVTYDLTFTYKERRLFKGDFHAHTLASDGVLTANELAWRAKRHGLDFVAITDHNQMVSFDSLPQLPDFTVIPGVEWTHFQGHANFLGVEKPYDLPFFTNTLQEAQQRFETAHQRGAVITVNHPFEPGMGFQFDLASLPYDCLEIWNGPMREPNLLALGFWQSLLAAGKKVPICGGSDYHRDSPFLFLGGPTTCVYAMSSSPSDILSALKMGHAYITFAPDGPALEMNAGECIMGDTVAWPEVKEIQITAAGLLTGDIIRVITPTTSTPILTAPAVGRFQAAYAIDAPGFARIEILRSFVPGLPMLPALISNPIYFEERSV